TVGGYGIFASLLFGLPVPVAMASGVAFSVMVAAGLSPSEDFPMAIAGKSFTFGSESSTSGRLMPEFFIRENTGKSPAEFLGANPGFSGSHDKTVELVESGEYLVGAVNYKVYNKRVKSGKTDPAVCSIIWTTPGYADYNFTAHPAVNTMFGDGFMDKLQQALIDMKDPELLSAFPRKSLIKAKNEDFQGIVDVAKDLGFLE
ncbi:MAG: PhnD/SsuA/transferrin family substrate-binding protein, partial [Planctomycetota bacterium]